MNIVLKVVEKDPLSIQYVLGQKETKVGGLAWIQFHWSISCNRS